jgi:LPS-assembly lipoprotein
MSLPDLKPIARRAFLGLALAGGATALTGCQPLYGPTATGLSLESELQAIAVNPVSGRVGHFIESELTFLLNGTGAKIDPKYRLTILVKERSQSPLVDTVAGRNTSATIIVDAYYHLTRPGQDEPVTKGMVFVTQSYDRTSQRLSNLQAARDAESRDAKELARQIKDRLALALAGR